MTSNTQADVYLYGAIGELMDIDTTMLVQQLAAMQKDGLTTVDFFVNSEGGEVVQGIAFYNFLDRSDLNVTWHIDGIAASMMAILVSNPKHKCIASKHAKMMYHRVQGYTQGNADDMRSYAEMMENFESSLINVLGGRMGKTDDEVKAMFFDGKDHWLSSQEALDMGLIDGIVDGAVEEPDMSNMKSAKDVMMYYSRKLTNKCTTKMDLKNIASALGLNDEADMTAIVDKVGAMTAENQSLKDRVAELESAVEKNRQAEVTALIDQAVKEKRIGEDEREDYTAIANNDMEQAKRMLAKRQPVVKIANEVNKTAPAVTSKTWDQLDKEGGLAELRKNNPEEYQRLFNEKFHAKN